MHRRRKAMQGAITLFLVLVMPASCRRAPLPDATTSILSSTPTITPSVRRNLTHYDNILAEDIQRCPYIYQGALDACQKQSCFGRCDDPFLFNLVCACDEVCKVYQDCCPDFDRECPKERLAANRKYTSIFKNAEISCVNGLKVITGCKTSNENKTVEETDDREATVTDENGFVFKNRSIYQCIYGKEKYLSKKSFGKKKINIFPNSSVAIIQDYVLTGVKNDEFIVEDIYPLGSLRRDCSPGFQISCSHLHIGQDCEIPNRFHVNDGYNFCASIMADRGGDTFSGSNLNTSVVSNQRQSESSPKEIINDGKYNKRCIIKTIPFIASLVLHEEVSILSSFYIKNAPKLNVFSNAVLRETSLNRHLRTIECRQDNLDGGCYLRVFCKNGYFPLQFVCRQPLRLIIQLLGKSSFSRLIEIQYDISLFLLKRFPSLLSTPKGQIQNETYIMPTHSGNMNLTNVLTIASYPTFLPYSDTKLPITEPLIQMLQRKKKNASVVVSRITVCFHVDGLNHLGENLVCDFIYFDNSGFNFKLEKHVIIPGDQLPNPKQENENEIRVRSRTNEQQRIISEIEITWLFCLYLLGLFLF